ncbi:MAG: hypothetical protein DMG13_31775 [Acidobacteria bacterium]|nr:MAG: hypothetical protein DMG13_31775 [Acidobacteriota bacterium]
MRKPSKGKTEKGEPYTEVPPSGRAFERIQQDRIARGLGEISKPGKRRLEDGRPAKKRKTKPAKRS